MLLPNVVYQFFFAPHHAIEPDPEKGPQNDLSLEPGEVEGGFNGSQVDLDTPPLPGSGDDAPDDESIDHEDDNEIIDELEQEEYPETQRPPRRRRFTFTNTFTSTTSASLSLWTRFKDALDPHTSPADLESYVPHYRYLPILSGIIIPFSILLEIPGLTEDWYIRTEDHKTVEIRKNTHILDTGLGFSIAFAAFANICLITRFMEKRVKMMTIFCVMLLTAHDLINIVAVVVFGVEHRFDDGFTYGQAYWMTVCSTSVSTITNITLIIDLVRTPDFDRSGSGLTRKQRTLVISVMALLTYIAIGALAETFLLGISFIDALYFTIVSIETVGFGDIVPITTGARVFTCLYSIFGIINLALVVGLTRETVLEGIEVGYRRRVKVVRQRRRALRFERRVVQRWNAAIDWRLRQAGLPMWVHDNQSRDHEHEIGHRIRHWFREYFWPWTKKESRYTRYMYGRTVGHAHPRGMHLNLESLSWAQLEAAAMEVGVPLRTLLPEGFKPRDQMVRECEKAFVGSGDGLDANNAGDNQATNDKGKGKNKESGKVKKNFYPPTLPEGTIPPPLTHARLGRMILMLGNFALAVDDESFVKVPKSQAAQKVKRRRQSLAAFSTTGDPNPGTTRTIAEQYESMRATMVDEERKAFWARFWMVWLVFLGFWIVGSVIFMTTEKWSFGIAVYFCFVAFTTIGYGDYTPVTPAGRSVFVFWALMGIATMTILISILSEAYSSRYKSIFTSSLITQAVKRYQDHARRTAQDRRQPQAATPTMVPIRGPDTGTTYVQPYSPLTASTLAPPIPLDAALLDSRKRVAGHLEALPEQVLRHARNFGEEAQFLIEPDAALTQDHDGVPEGLKKLMDDVAGVERLGERIKGEILHNSEARQGSALLAISIENVLKKIVEIAEEALEAVRERDQLTQLKTADVGLQTSPEIEETDGIRFRQRPSHVDGEGEYSE